MTSTTTDPLKARHRTMWGLGDYPLVADTVIPDLGAVLVDACGVKPGDHVLDVAAGSGNAAIPAARAGAQVVASDLTPSLLEAGKARAEDLPIRWEEADAEALPYADGSFDVVLSCLGVMFAPHHQAGADELVRVCRTGGTIGVLSWTPGGFIGQLFATMKPYVPLPPPGVGPPPPLWGSPEHVRFLFGDRVRDVETRVATTPVAAFTTAEEFRDFFKTHYGPTVGAYRGIADEPDRVAALDADLAALASRFDVGGGAMEWEYLLVTATAR
jgi:ubiquinone/menaquinone biosynthesis C-methylase UbiE